MTNSIWLIILIGIKIYHVGQDFHLPILMSNKHKKHDEHVLSQLKLDANELSQIDHHIIVQKFIHLLILIQLIQMIGYLCLYLLYPVSIALVGTMTLIFARVYLSYQYHIACNKNYEISNISVIIKNIKTATKPLTNSLDFLELIVYILILIAIV